MNSKSAKSCFAWFLSAAFAVSVTAAVDAPYEVGAWGNFAKGAVSFTFDDNTPNQISVAQPLFDAKGFHMTFFVVLSWSPNWTNYQAAFTKGHEIGSHSISHPQTMPNTEIDSSQKIIRQNVPGEKCVSIAYPNCNEPDEATLKKYFVVGRTCSGQNSAKTPTNMFQVGSTICGSAGLNTTKAITDKADAAATSGGWCVLLMHGIDTEPSGSSDYSPTSSTVLGGALDYMNSNRGKLWVESMGNVARYIRERDAASVSKKDSTDKSFTLTVTDNLPDSIFNFPLTIRRPLPDGWTTAYVVQGQKDVKDTVITESTKKYVMFQAIPDSGTVVISKDPPPVAVVNRFVAAGADGTAPVTLQGATLTVDPCRFGNADLTVSLFGLNGKVLARYTLSGNKTAIVLPADKYSRTVFVAHVTGGGETWHGKFALQK